MQRWKTRPQFQAVLAGKTLARTPHFALHCTGLGVSAPAQAGEAALLFPQQSVWLGAMVPKRWAKRAVTRNAIKRQIYTVSADFSRQYPQAAYVVRLRRDFSRKEFISATSEPLKQAVRAEVRALLLAGVGAA